MTDLLRSSSLSLGVEDRQAGRNEYADSKPIDQERQEK